VNRHQFELPLGSGIDRGMTIVQYGHYGRPVLVFPSESGRAWDFENNGMLDAIGNLINDGRVKLYCVDTLDADTWADKGLPIEERALRHEVYTRWLTHHVVSHIHSDTSPGAELITLGCSLGPTTRCASPCSGPIWRHWPSGCPATTTSAPGAGEGHPLRIRSLGL
jgi:esterase/lipase superfamily enzyme